ncbi:hypothetical protein ACJIZ3_024325 [Penstemon smallii]|uniref:Uncharacterized protein n=1 Tax=Penstemon smallii TaxID=265156 RepID=A0ABD3TRH7_9LAMI
MEVYTSILFSFGTTTNITIPKFTKPRYQTTKIRWIGWNVSISLNECDGKKVVATYYLILLDLYTVSVC